MACQSPAPTYFYQKDMVDDSRETWPVKLIPNHLQTVQISIDWFKGKSTGNPNIFMGKFLVSGEDFPLSPPIVQIALLYLSG